MNYQSPIELIRSQMRTAVENEVLSAVQRIGVNVDKEELLKALAYDRDQYMKGYNDRDHEIVRCKDCKHGSLYCTEDVCGETLIECNRPDLGDAIEIHGWKWFCADGERKEDSQRMN